MESFSHDLDHYPILGRHEIAIDQPMAPPSKGINLDSLCDSQEDAETQSALELSGLKEVSSNRYKRVSLQISSRLHREARLAAHEDEETLSSLIVTALRIYLRQRAENLDRSQRMQQRLQTTRAHRSLNGSIGS